MDKTKRRVTKHSGDLRSKRTPLYEKAVDILWELEEAEGAADRAFAEVYTVIFENLWKEDFTRSSGTPCVESIVKGRHATNNILDYNDRCRLPSGCDDHSVMWNKEGKPAVYEAQPYDLSYEDLKELVAFCGERNLRADLSARSWWFPSWTISIAVRKNK